MNTITLSVSSLNMTEQAKHDVYSLLTRYGITLIHVIGSPGSGKTTFIHALLGQNVEKTKTAVITANSLSSIDGERIDQIGVQALHIFTPEAAILDAGMLLAAIDKLALHDIKWLFVENIGTLLIPDNYSISATFTVLVFSVAEGTDKPFKYSAAFKHADTIFFNKTDLLPFTNFNLRESSKHIYKLNPSALLLNGSATRPSTMEHVWDHLQKKISEKTSR